MVSNKYKTRAVAAGIAVLALGLTACSSDDDGETPAASGAATEGAERRPHPVGFSQVGAESGWRTANTESVKESLIGGERLRPDVRRRAAEAGEPDQGDARLHRAGRRRHRVLARSSRPAGTRCCRRSRTPTSPSSSSTARSTRTVDDPYVTWIGADFKQEGTTAGEWVNGERPRRQDLRAAGHARLRRPGRPRGGLRRGRRRRRSSARRPATSRAPRARRPSRPPCRPTPT